MPTLSREQVLHAARSAIETLEQNGLDVCLFGSAACAVYGMQRRDPNDVDLIVMTQGWDPEEIKDLLVTSSDAFYLVPSRDPNADYRVLWYEAEDNSRWTCKVDILVPGLLSIPQLSPEYFVRFDGEEDLPLIPLLTLILLKLRGWCDHMDDHRRRMQEKTWVDEEDIDEMLDLAIEDGWFVDDDSKTYLPEWLIEESYERIERFMGTVPDSAAQWAEIGFPVEE